MLFDIPKVLFPRMSRRGMVSPITGPATYQGHGFKIFSNISVVLNGTLVV
jgi:hypothetical protein